MTEARPAPETSIQKRPSAAKAWTAIALSPVGVIAGIAAAYLVAAVIGVTIDPANGAHLTFAQNTLIYSIVTVVVLAAPVTAVVLAVRPARMGSTSARAAFGVGILLIVGALAMMIPSLVSW